MNKLKVSVTLLLLFVVLIKKTTAQTLHKITIKEAVEMAFKNLPSLKNMELDYKIQQQQNKIIEASAYPQITGNVGVNNYLALLNNE